MRRGAGIAGLCVAVAVAAACGAVSAPHAAPPPPPGAGAGAPNNPLPGAGIDVCVRPRRPRGIPAYTLGGTRLPFTVATGHEPGTRPRCADGELRILRLTTVPVDGAPAYVRRGGCQQPCVVRQPTVLVRARDLTRAVGLAPSTVLAGDGAPVAGCTRTVVSAPARAGDALGRMYYKTPAEIGATRRRTGNVGAGARWSNYGDPGRRFRSASGAHADYGYLLWNLPRRAGGGGPLPGGGIVEAPLAAGTALGLCPVATLRLPSFDARGAPNGDVVFAYAQTLGPVEVRLYGWLLLGYRYRARPFRATTTAGPGSARVGV